MAKTKKVAEYQRPLRKGLTLAQIGKEIKKADVAGVSRLSLDHPAYMLLQEPTPETGAKRH